jgi:hypothetical protein
VSRLDLTSHGRAQFGISEGARNGLRSMLSASLIPKKPLDAGKTDFDFSNMPLAPLFPTTYCRDAASFGTKFKERRAAKAAGEDVHDTAYGGKKAEELAPYIETAVAGRKTRPPLADNEIEVVPASRPRTAS